MDQSCFNQFSITKSKYLSPLRVTEGKNYSYREQSLNPAEISLCLDISTLWDVCSGLSLSEKDWALDLACHQQSARPALGQ